jgi:hypothetical protein
MIRQIFGQLTLAIYYIWQNICMKNFLLLCLSVFMLLSCGGTKHTAAEKKDTGAYIAPGYEKKKYNKIMVMALLQQGVYRKRVEKAVVDQLKDRGFKVVASTEIFTDEMLKDTLAMRKTSEASGVDAAIVLTSLGTNATTVDRASYAGNFYGFYGYSFAIIDIEGRSAAVTYMQMDFMVVDKLGTQYRVAIPVNTSNDPETAMQQFGLGVRDRLIGDRIL